jgi:hypothetical protein
MKTRFRRRGLFIILLVSVLGSMSLQAETRRAVLVGINKYVSQTPAQAASKPVSTKGRGGWFDLDGSLNDIEVMRELLQARFHFKPENIVVLEDSQATREAILASIRKHLIDESSSGDVAFFYYSGHGSRVTNSLNGEEGHKDQTIVPADANTGVWDIRDKEIASLFNRALDKGIILTAVFDSCHSGSIARGLPPMKSGKARWLPDDTRDVRTPPDPGKRPEERTELKERGILIFSAAQDYEVALEARDEAAPVLERRPRGAFSLALTRVLQGVPENESASRVFNEVSTYLMSENYRQIPVMSGTAERRAAPLFGIGTAGTSADLRVSVLSVDGDEVEIRGGYAIGLTPGCELKMDAAEGQTPVRIRVIGVKDLSRSAATVFEGSAKAIQPGLSLFKVEKWASSNAESALKVWWPSTPPKFQDVDSIRGEIDKLTSSGKIAWVQDPTVESPSWVVRCDGTSWKLQEVATGHIGSLGWPLSANAILTAIRPGNHGLPKVFVEIPPPTELVKQLRLGSGTQNDAISLAKSADEANYILVGRLEGEDLQVAWIMPYATVDLANTPMPVRSDWHIVKDSPESLQSTSLILEDTAQRLQKIKGWLLLRSMGGDTSFPYHLAFMNTQTNKVTENEPLLKGETYNLVLRRDKLPPGAYPAQRRVYVFAIDSWGRGTLLYPLYGEVENLLPPAGELENGQDIVLKSGTRPFKIQEPLGLDAYFLLTSEEPLGDPTILNFDGVRTRGIKGEISSNPLCQLLQQVGAASRGQGVVAPTNWSIQHYVVRSVRAQ